MVERVVGRLLGTVALAASLAVAGLGSAVAAPPAVPAPVQRLAAEHRPGADAHARTGLRQTLRVPEADPEDDYLAVEGGCVRGSGRTRPAVALYSDRKLTLDYRLTGTGGVDKHGTVKVKKRRETAIKLPKVGLGTYRLVLTEHGGETTVADQSFDVLPCVTVQASCRAVTFTNPVGNPTASIAYGASFDARFWVDLAGGASATARIDVRTIRYTAYADDDLGVGTDVGSGKVRVKQKCSHGQPQPGQLAVQSSATIGCATADATAPVDLHWAAQPSLDQRHWLVLDDTGATVVEGDYRSGRDRTVDLRAGAYRYQSFANGLTTPFEDVAFRVLSCVEVTPACRALEVTNPNPVAVDVVAIGSEDTEPSSGPSEVTVAGGETVSIPVGGDTAYLFALPSADDGSPLFYGFAAPLPGDDDEGYAIPQTC